MIISTAVSNVTGEKSDLLTLGNVCKKHNLIFLVDAAQGAGHIEIDMEKMNIDMLAFAGHKGLNSLTGVGGLVVSNNIKLKPELNLEKVFKVQSVMLFWQTQLKV